MLFSGFIYLNSVKTFFLKNDNLAYESISIV